jgi:putative ATP-dependent endonuclease of OLD family
MKINSISITNIKSFKSKTRINFDHDFNVIVGPNASGKSNLLDIITICLRGFFLKSYVLDRQNNIGSGNYKPVIQLNNLSLDQTTLDKYQNSSDPSKIEFEFLVTQSDLDNIKSFRKNTSELISIIQSETSSYESIIGNLKGAQWDETIFSVGDIIPFTIENNSIIHLPWPIHDGQNTPTDPYEELRPKVNMFMYYLNLLNLFNVFSDRFNALEFQNPFLLFSPYRSATNAQDFQATLANSSSSQLAGQLINTNSKTTTSLIKMASTYFAEKLRKFEHKAKSVGFEALWMNDPEVKLVTSYLEKLGYSWRMNLLNENQNIYEIELKKDGQELSISQTSSGEKEIINYLFGIFALKIKNGLIIIDEPELHLHPRWQLLLLDLFKELSINTHNQFIITTHSPVFINTTTVSNLIRIFRTDKESKHIALKTTSNVKDLLHLINSTNNEKVFFADLLILVEGVTDNLVFQKIVNLMTHAHNILSVVEVVEIKGKGNIKKFRKYLQDLKIPYAFIADLDYIHEVGSKAIHKLFDTDLKAVDSNAIKNGRSSDGNTLIELLEASVKHKNFDELSKFLEYMKSFRKKLRDDLSEDEKHVLHAFIAKHQKDKQEYILEEGAIEKYFPAGYKAKDLDKVLELLSDKNFQVWQKTDQYKKLDKIILDILISAGLIATTS